MNILSFLLIEVALKAPQTLIHFTEILDTNKYWPGKEKKILEETS